MEMIIIRKSRNNSNTGLALATISYQAITVVTIASRLSCPPKQ